MANMSDSNPEETQALEEVHTPEIECFVKATSGCDAMCSYMADYLINSDSNLRSG
jgi:hypothetical protein